MALRVACRVSTVLIGEDVGLEPIDDGLWDLHLVPCGSGASMNVGTASNRRACGDDDDARRMEAAGPVDAKNAPTSSLENAQNAFPTAPTRIIHHHRKDKTVT